MQFEFISQNNDNKKNQVKKFLQKFLLDYENIDTTLVVYEENKIIATCSKKNNLIKCIAVDPNYQNLNLLNLLITKIMKEIFIQGYDETLLITKEELKLKFLDIGFNLIYQNNTICFFTNNINKFNDYQKYVEKTIGQINSQIAIMVMNCNPFTKGHEYLIDQAKELFDVVFIIPVKEDVSLFTYKERKEMIKENIKSKENIFFIRRNWLFNFKIYFSKLFFKFWWTSNFTASIIRH